MRSPDERNVHRGISFYTNFKNSKTLNEALFEKIKNNPSLSIIMVSRCRAVGFVDNKTEYNYDTSCVEKKEYHSYACFE